MQILYVILAVLFGYLIWKLLSTPGGKVNRKVPKIKYKNIELLPSSKIKIKGRIIHLHHWVYLTLLFVVSFMGPSWLDSSVARAFIFGGIVQGLRFPDRGIFKREPNEKLDS